MKSKLILILVVGFLVSPLAAQAIPIIFKAPLLGLSEVPPNASPGIGEVKVTVDDVAKTMRVETLFSGLLGNTAAAHIHCCAPVGTNVGVATGVPTFLGFPAGVTSGSYDTIFDMTLASSYNPAFVTANGGTTDSAFNALLGGLNAGMAYFNLHSNLFPGGEIRGNLQIDVPVPGTLFLMGVALAGMALRRLRQMA